MKKNKNKLARNAIKIRKRQRTQDAYSKKIFDEYGLIVDNETAYFLIEASKKESNK